MGPRRAILLDIDGVLTVSWRAFPGAGAAVERLRSLGWPLAFVTNTTSLPRRAIAENLRTAGIEVADGEIFTAPRAAAAFLRQQYPEARCLLLNSGSVEEDLQGVNLADGDADLVLTGGAGPEIGYEDWNRAYRLLLSGAPFIAMQRNLSWVTEAGPQLDMGAFLAGLEQASGVNAVVIGKPAPEFYTAVLQALGAEAAGSVMIGDDIESDVLGAQAVGIRGVLVRTGKFRPEALEVAPGKPDHVIDSVADVPDLLELV